MTNFPPLEVVDRGSETQPQVVENLNKFTQQDKDLLWKRWNIFVQTTATKCFFP